MSAQILDGKKAAAAVYRRIEEKSRGLAARGVIPGLATVLVGDDAASSVYVNQKIKSCEKHGLKSFHVKLPGDLPESALLRRIDELNGDPNVHGIIVQLPLPPGINAGRVLLALDPRKDADGLHPLNQGRWIGMKSWPQVEAAGVPLPCTPWGVMELLAQNGIHLGGLRAAVVGRSNLVGKPLAMMLLAADATVTMCHSRTPDLPRICRDADLIVAAIGSPRFVTGDMVKRKAVVVDVGISRTDQGLVGDVDFGPVSAVAGAVTPVPGGVGPMTVAMLLWNTVLACERGAG